MDEEKKESPKTVWTHGAKVGLGPVRAAVRETRDSVAKTMEELKAELGKKKAVLARFGRH